MEGKSYLGGSDVCAQAIKQAAPLNRISEHADAAERIGDLIEMFLGRCRGCEGAIGSDTLRSVTSGHFAELERLEKYLARAEELARDLANIG